MSGPLLRPVDIGLPPTVAELREQELEPVTVAVLDSGIDATHDLLQGRVVEAFHIDPGDEALEVQAGSIEENNDVFGHGSAVCSVVAAVAPNARIVDVRVLRPGNQGAGPVLVAGLRHAIDHGAQVINMSLAATAKFARPLHPLLEKAYRQGQAVVASKRNMPFADQGYPAEFMTSVSVDSEKTEEWLRLLYQPGEIIEFAANGEEVEVANAGGGLRRVTGTSFAAPLVSGVIALLLGVRPDLRPFEIKTILKAYASV